MNIDEEIKKIERRDKKRKRDNSSEEEGGDGMARAIHRAERITMRRAAATTRVKKSRSRSGSSSSSDSTFEKPMTQAQTQALKKTREQYELLRADLLSFKQTKVGSLLDESNLEVQAKLTPLAL